MAKSDIEKRIQSVEDFFNEIQSYLIGKLPIGSEINLLLNARSNIRRTRLIRFFESFREELQKVYGKPLETDQITSEEFLDVMEAIMIKVQATKSAYKVERFRNILLRQAINPIDHQFALKYVQVIDDLSDVQMIMLSVFNGFNSISKPWDFKYVIWKKYNPEGNTSSNIPSGDFDIQCAGQTIAIKHDELQFYFSDLITKNLVKNKNEDKLSIPNMNMVGWPTSSNAKIPVSREKNDRYELTDFAEALLKFVTTEEDKRELA